MKLILAVVDKDDAKAVSKGLMSGGFGVTKLASTGGFLSKGSVTLLTGVRTERVQQALDTIKECSASRKYSAAKIPVENRTIDTSGTFPTEITVGGATVFVLNIEECKKF